MNDAFGGMARDGFHVGNLFAITSTSAETSTARIEFVGRVETLQTKQIDDSFVQRRGGEGDSTYLGTATHGILNSA